MSSGEDEQRDLVESLRSVRDAARATPEGRPVLPSYDETVEPAPPHPRLSSDGDPGPEGPTSPSRDDVNARWNVAEALSQTPQGALGRLLSPLRAPLRRIVRFALGPVVERQVEMNSAQVRFDNELVTYLDARLDRMGHHYDRVLGLHGKRMEEIDERHLILQQELIRHVHDLVERIEFVFETAETNHLQVDGVLRETREELRELRQRLDALSATGSDGT